MFRRGPVLLAAALFATLGADRAGVRADLPTRSARVVSYTIRATLDPAERAVHGAMEVVWRNATEAPVDHFYVHLYLNAFADEHSTFMREWSDPDPAVRDLLRRYPGGIEVEAMRREDGTELWTDATRRFEAPDDGNADDRTLARVDLPAPVAPGETIALQVEFTSRLPRVVARTGWAGDPSRPDGLFFLVAQWFPKIAALTAGADGTAQWNRHQFHRNTEFFADFGVYRVAITAPDAFVVGATGRCLARASEGGATTHQYVAEDVHDFAWTASPGFVERTFTWDFATACEQVPALGGLLTRTAGHLDLPPERVAPAQAVEVRLLLQADHDRMGRRIERAVVAALGCYGIWFGAYPYDVLTVVDVPAGGGAAGGMEYPTLITVQADRTAPPFATGLEAVTVHEFGHQYFYGLVASNEFTEAWIDEGLTTFSAGRVQDVALDGAIATTHYAPFHTAYARPFEPPAVYARLHALLRGEAWIDRLPRPWRLPESLAPIPRENGLWSLVRDQPALHFDRHVPAPAAVRARRSILESGTHDTLSLEGWEYATRRDYAVNSYAKPAAFLTCMRGLMGERAFDRALHDFATRYRFGHPTGENLGEAILGQVPEEEQPALEALLRAMAERAGRFDAALLSVTQRELAGGAGWEWTVRAQWRGDLVFPLEIHAVDEHGAGERIALWIPAPGETTRTFRVVRDRRLAAVRLGPDALRHIDGDLSNNARVADGAEDARVALVLATRWTLFAEEVLRMYAGLGR